MTFRALLSAHLSDAVVASVIFTLYNVYTRDAIGPLAIGIDFLSYVVAIFVGFVVIDTLWDSVFGSDGA